MQGAQRGDAEAFGTLFQRYQKAIFNFMRRLGMTAASAEEGTQDIFLKLWERREQYHAGRNFRVYLYQIARNHWLNQLRRKPVNPARYLDGRGGAEADPAVAAEKSDLEAKVREAIAGLPETIRVPLILKLMQQLTYSEVSGITGLSPRQAEERVSEAFQVLGARLREREARAAAPRRKS